MRKKSSVALSFTFLLVIVLSGFIVYTLLGFVKSDITEIDSTVDVGKGVNVNITLPRVRASDRVYMVLNTSSRVQVTPNPALEQLPYDIEGIPFDFEDWLLFQQRSCFIANESSEPTIHVGFLDSGSPYSVKVFEGEANYTLFNVEEASANYTGVYVETSTNQSSRFQQVMLIYPYSRIAQQDFHINGSLRLLSGTISQVSLIIITRDRNWLPFRLVSESKIFAPTTINFNVDLYNRTIFGRTFSEDFGKQIHYVAISIGLDSLQWPWKQTAYAKVGIGNMAIYNGNETTIITPELAENYPVNYSLYVFRKFQPTLIYQVSVLALTFSMCAVALILVRTSGSKIEMQRVFGPLITTEAASDPRPNTYLAKLFHKPRYEGLMAMLLEFADKEISVLIDVGCGKGVFREYLDKNSFSVDLYVGVDLDKETLEKVSNIERVLCDAHHLPFKKNIADVIVCSEVLEHTADPNSGFGELLEVSRQLLFVSFPDERLKNALGFRYPEHISEPNAEQFRHLAKKNGFGMLKEEKKFFAFPPSVFDKLWMSNNASYRPIIVSLFQLFSRACRDVSLIKTVFLVFERK